MRADNFWADRVFSGLTRVNMIQVKLGGRSFFHVSFVGSGRVVSSLTDCVSHPSIPFSRG